MADLNTANVIANAATHLGITGGIIAIAGFLIKNWVTDVKGSIDKLSDHVATTNGRIAKTEGAIGSIKDVCEERSKIFYSPYTGQDRRKGN